MKYDQPRWAFLGVVLTWHRDQIIGGLKSNRTRSSLPHSLSPGTLSNRNKPSQFESHRSSVKPFFSVCFLSSWKCNNWEAMLYCDSPGFPNAADPQVFRLLVLLATDPSFNTSVPAPVACPFCPSMCCSGSLS
jgi:hypothetical protein